MTQKMKQQIGELFLLAVQANMSKEFNVWFELVGHVDMLALRISDEDHENVIFNDSVYLERQDFNKIPLAKTLIDWKIELLNIIAPKIVLDEN